MSICPYYVTKTSTKR